MVIVLAERIHMCITGKCSYDKQDAKRYSKNRKYLKRYYYCKHCGHYHTTSQSNGIKRNTDIKNELIIERIQNGESEFLTRLSNTLTRHLVTLADVTYVANYNNKSKSCNYWRFL